MRGEFVRSVAWSDESFKFTLRGGNRLGNRGLLLESVRPEFRQNFWPNTISTSSPPTWARVTLIRPNLPTVFVSPPLSYARAPKHPPQPQPPSPIPSPSTPHHTLHLPPKLDQRLRQRRYGALCVGAHPDRWWYGGAT